VFVPGDVEDGRERLLPEVLEREGGVADDAGPIDLAVDVLIGPCEILRRRETVVERGVRRSLTGSAHRPLKVVA